MTSEFIPDIHSDNFDQNHVNNQEWKDADAVKESEGQLRRDSVQELFKGYYYNKHDFSLAPEPTGVQSTMPTTGMQMTTKAKETVENEPVLLTGKKGLVEDEIQEEDVKD